MVVLYLYIFCDIAEQIKTHFDLTYGCNWYRLSVKQQKFFLLMIMIQQDTVCLHGMTKAQYDRDMFKRVN